MVKKVAHGLRNGDSNLEPGQRLTNSRIFRSNHKKRLHYRIAENEYILQREIGYYGSRWIFI